jgi:hypothetical protein
MDQRRILALLLALTLVRGLIFAVIIPPWQAPDETGHFEYAWLIAQLGRLPTREDVSPLLERELIESLYEWRYGESIGRPLPEQVPARMEDLPPEIPAKRSRTILIERFSLAYVWLAPFIWLFRHQDLVSQLYAVRFSSVVLELGVVWLAWLIFREVLPRQQWLVVSMTALVVFLPQHAFINASAGDGPLAELAACVVIYGWLRLFRGPVRVWWIIAVLGGTLVGLSTKNTTAFLVPFNLVALALLLITRYRDAIQRRRWSYVVLGLVLVAFLGAIILQTPVGDRARSFFQLWSRVARIHLVDGSKTLDQALLGTYDSFWARFGWMSVRAEDGWYIVIYVLTIWAIGGWIIPRSRGCSVPAYAKGILGAALALSLAVWLAYVLFMPSGFRYTQGRYFFPVIAPVAFFLVGGWARWVPARWERYFAPGVVLLLVGLDLVALLALWRYYYVGFYG